MLRFLFYIVMSISFFVSSACYAVDLSTVAAVSTLSPVSVWLNAGFMSRHFDRKSGYRESNIGFGAEVGLPVLPSSVVLGTFLNSDNAHSRYVGLTWQPLVLGPVKIGGVVGGVDGYSRVQHGGWFPIALPMASIEVGPLGFNVMLVPSYQDKLRGAIVGQLKLKVW